MELLIEPLIFFLNAALVISIYGLCGMLLLPWVAGVEKLPGDAKFFLKLVLGFFLFTSCYAVFFTSGRSILSFVVIFYAALLIWNRRQGRRVARSHFTLEWKPWAECLAVCLILCVIQLFRNDYFNQEIVYTSFIDFGIYSTVTEYLKITGVEMSSPWYQLFDVSAEGLVKPYHYMDLWGMGLLLDISGESPVDDHIYSWVPLVSAIFFSGLKSIFNAVYRRNTWPGIAFLTAFLALFVNMLIDAVPWSDEFGWNLFLFPKILPLSFGFAIWIISQLFKIPWLDIFTLLVIMLSYILLVPIVFIAFSLYYSLRYALAKNKTDLYKLLLLSAGPVLIYLFYAYGGTFQTSSDATAPLGPEGYAFWFVKLLVASQVKFYLYFAPVIAVIFLAFAGIIPSNFDERMVLFSFPAVSFAGSLAYAFFNNNVETFQFTGMAHAPGIQMAVVIALGLLFNSASVARLKWISLSLAFIIFAQLIFGIRQSLDTTGSMFNSYSAKFIEQTKRALLGKNRIGVSVIYPPRNITYSADPRICYACNFLKKIGDNYWANQISIPEDMNNLPYPERKTAIELSPFYRFKEQMRQNDPAYSFEKAQMEFINRYEVDFLVLEKDATPPRWLPHCVEQVIEDPESGTALILLKRPCSANGIVE